MVYDSGCDGFVFKDMLLDALDVQEIFAFSAALRRGYTADHVHTRTYIDPRFLSKLHNIVVTCHFEGCRT